MSLATLALVSTLAVAASTADSADSGGTRRFAVAIGVNDGGPGRTELRYADRDAKAVADLLTELGGVTEPDLELLLNADRSTIEGALQQIRRRLEAAKASGQRTELVVYYSGHSDAEGLLVRGQTLPFAELRDRISAMPAEVRVVILDSCASGAFTRAKGGKRRPPFLQDLAVDVRGHAFLTSSAEDELSQESDKIGASYFTHALLSGLRGAADSTADGRVTLHEAYQFAYNETLARTAGARFGAQHPAFEMRLAGKGDLVVTDLRVVDASLVLDEALFGRVLVHDNDGRLVVELMKAADKEVVLGLPPGDYQLTVAHDDGALRGDVKLARGARRTVKASDLVGVALALTRARGDAPARTALVNVGIVWPVESNTMVADHIIGTGVDNLISFSLLGGRSRNVTGFALSFVWNWIDDDLKGVALSTGLNTAGDDVLGGQIGVLGNLAVDDVIGAQLSAGGNLVLGDLYGPQIGAVFNYAGGESYGPRIAAGTNLNFGTARGFALSVANIDATLQGAQIGVVNIGDTVQGAQIGVINIARKVQGAQIGVVNLADEMYGAPFGILSLARNGQAHVGLYTNELDLVGVELKLGAKYFYGTLAFGAQPLTEQRRFTMAIGPGVHLPFEPFWVDLQLLGGNVREHFLSEGLDIYSTLKLTAGWQPLPYFSVYAGLSANAFIAFAEDAERVRMPLEYRIPAGNVVTVLWPGLILGVQL